MKRFLLMLAMITVFLVGYLCGLLWAYKQVVVVAEEIMVYESKPIVEKPLEEEEEETLYLGVFKVTAYCPCKECSDEWGYETSTGAVATEGRTIAVDPKVIPYGSEVVIDGHTYKAEDCGGLIKGNRVDIFFESHNDVDAYGLQKHNVYLNCEV